MTPQEQANEYRSSYLNTLLRCCEAVRNGVEAAYENRKTDEFMIGLCEEYGYETVSSAVSNHISLHIYDGRYDNLTKDWASQHTPIKRLPSMHDTTYDDIQRKVQLGNTHPVIVNLIAHWVIDNEKSSKVFPVKTSKMKLSERVDQELNQYEDWLLSLNPKEILHHTYEHSVLCDIVFVIKDQDTVSEETARKLLNSPNILADLSKDLDKLDLNINEEICSVIEERAEKLAAKSTGKSKNPNIDFGK